MDRLSQLYGVRSAEACRHLLLLAKASWKMRYCSSERIAAMAERLLPGPVWHALLARAKHLHISCCLRVYSSSSARAGPLQTAPLRWTHRASPRKPLLTRLSTILLDWGHTFSMSHFSGSIFSGLRGLVTCPAASFVAQLPQGHLLALSQRMTAKRLGWSQV